MAKQLSENSLFQNCSNSDPFIINRARSLLNSQLEEKGVVRVTYIAFKQQLIAEFGETEFGRNKGAIQKVLKSAISKENPKVVEAYTQEKARLKQQTKLANNEVQDQMAAKYKIETKSVKSPRLYFYKMNEEETGSAEGNRYISNDDL
eukprot:g6522.t1